MKNLPYVQSEQEELRKVLPGITQSLFIPREIYRKLLEVLEDLIAGSYADYTNFEQEGENNSCF